MKNVHKVKANQVMSLTQLKDYLSAFLEESETLNDNIVIMADGDDETNGRLFTISKFETLVYDLQDSAYPYLKFFVHNRFWNLFEFNAETQTFTVMK